MLVKKSNSLNLSDSLNETLEFVLQAIRNDNHRHAAKKILGQKLIKPWGLSTCAERASPSPDNFI
jgi:hypothetical protein